MSTFLSKGSKNKDNNHPDSYLGQLTRLVLAQRAEYDLEFEMICKHKKQNNKHQKWLKSIFEL